MPVSDTETVRERVYRFLTDADKRGQTPSINEIAARSGMPVFSVRHAVRQLREKGKVVSRMVCASSKRWEHSIATGAAEPEAPKARPAAAAARQITTANSGDPYMGEEMQPNPGLPASRFAAYLLPSRVGQTLRYRDGRVTDLAGNPIA